MSGRYNWVRHEGGKLYQVGILADGTLYNPNGYPEDIVRAAVLATDARRHERRSEAALEAARTRARRRGGKINAIARKIAANTATGPRSHCYVCGRGLSDPQSVERGIGSECWQGVLSEIEKVKAERAA